MDDDSTNASAESTRELKRTQESKKRRGKTLLKRYEKMSNAVLDEEAA